jgi:mRNA-degrading endonuclease RelE of RelBE toxin-antitoxin system
MTNTVVVSQAFIKDAKALLKKFHSLKTSIDNLISALIEDPYLGDAYGDKIYKVRLSDKSKGGGKSGGFRVMYYHLSKTDKGIEILLMTIFDKSDTATISKAQALKKLGKILDEL